jgi:Domain of unknown function (DUF5753)
MLTGKHAVKETDVATLLGICRVKDRERARLLKLCQEANKRGWWQQRGSRLPKQLRTLIDHEDSAIRIGDYQGTLSSGLLQTADYARATIACSADLPAEEADARISSRLTRAKIFGRRTVALHVLRARIRSSSTSWRAAVMSEQFHHLLQCPDPSV